MLAGNYQKKPSASLRLRVCPPVRRNLNACDCLLRRFPVFFLRKGRRKRRRRYAVLDFFAFELVADDDFFRFLLLLFKCVGVVSDAGSKLLLSAFAESENAE